MITCFEGFRRVGVAAVLCGAVSLSMVTGCKDQMGGNNKDADTQAIRDADAAWAKTSAAHDVDGIVSYYADNAVVMPPNMPLMADKATIKAAWTGMMVPGNDLAWKTVNVEVSSSGDLGYCTGTYVATMKDAKGVVMNEKGKYTEVWRKQADGKWKAVVDMWSADAPAVVASAPAPATSTAPATAPSTN